MISTRTSSSRLASLLYLLYSSSEYHLSLKKKPKTNFFVLGSLVLFTTLNSHRCESLSLGAPPLTSIWACTIEASVLEPFFHWVCRFSTLYIPRKKFVNMSSSPTASKAGIDCDSNSTSPRDSLAFILKIFLRSLSSSPSAHIKTRKHVLYVLLLIGTLSIAVGTTFYHWSSGQLDRMEGYSLTGTVRATKPCAIPLSLYFCLYKPCYEKSLGRWRYFSSVQASLFYLSISHTYSLAQVRHHYRLILNPLCSSTVAFKRPWRYFSIAVLNSSKLFKIALKILYSSLSSKRQSGWQWEISALVATCVVSLDTNLFWAAFPCSLRPWIGKHALLAQRVYDPFSDLSEDLTFNIILIYTTVSCLLFQFGPISFGLRLYSVAIFKVGLWLVQNGKTEWGAIWLRVMPYCWIYAQRLISNGFVDRASLNMLYWPILAAGYTLKEFIEENETLIVEKYKSIWCGHHLSGSFSNKLLISD